MLTEAQVKRKYRRFDDDVWEKLGSDDALVDAIEAERTRRVRSGARPYRSRGGAFVCTREGTTAAMSNSALPSVET